MMFDEITRAIADTRRTTLGGKMLDYVGDPPLPDDEAQAAAVVGVMETNRDKIASVSQVVLEAWLRDDPPSGQQYWDGVGPAVSDAVVALFKEKV